MKLSLALTPNSTKFAPLLFAGNLFYGIRRAAELGYDGIELNIRDPLSEDLDSIIAVTEAYGLKIVSLGTGQAYLADGLSVAASDPEISAKCLRRLENHVDFASRVGAQVVIGGIRGRFDSDPDLREIQYYNAVDISCRIADYALSRGVVITFEPINRYETNFLNTFDDAIAFLDTLKRSNVRILLDTYHMNIEEVRMAETFVSAAEILSHIHLVDSNRRAPGMGHINFRSIIDALHSIGYEGYLSGEFLPLPDDNTAAESNIMYINKLLGR